MAQMSFLKKPRLIAFIVVLGVAALGWYGWTRLNDGAPPEGFAVGNGRIEATEIDIATKLPGRISDVLVREGDFVTAGQVLAKMQVDTLQAQREEAVAAQQEALQAVAAARSQIALRESDVVAGRALVAQREAELGAARSRLMRSQTLSQEGAASRQELDDDRARVHSTEAALTAARAQVAAAQAAVEAARAQEVGTHARVSAVQASIGRIDADIADSDLKSPRDARVQLRLAQPGEVLGAGGRALNLVDLADVYMTFFLPESAAGRVALGSEVRIVLDALPQTPIPARVSFIASTAQFTPKTVETASERQKLMFRVKAQIPPELLRRYPEQVKTGLPGVAWIRLDADAPWPDRLSTSLAE